MQKSMLALLCFSLHSLIALPCPPVKELPWINGKDEEAMYYAIPFLPENPVILEAGMFYGEDTLLFKKQWPDSTIYGFEAHPKHFKNALKRLGNQKGVFLYKKALFDHVGTITFYCSDLQSGASSVLEDNKKNVENVFNDPPEQLSYLDKPVEVECTTIDHWAGERNISKIDYIWLDTEGAELYILQNALSILPSVKVLSLEANFQEFRKGMTKFQDLYDFLTDHDFVLKSIWGHHNWQSVAMFVHKDLLPQ